jgi:hypothetical protein
VQTLFLSIAMGASVLGGPKIARTDVIDQMTRAADQGDWAVALPLSQQVTAANPTYPFAWMVMGWSFEFTKRYAEAKVPLEKARELGAIRLFRIDFEMARCEAGQGHADEAMHLLKLAYGEGYPSLDAIQEEPLFEPLKNRPDFREMTGWADPSQMSRTEKWTHDLHLLYREIKRIHSNPYRYVKPGEWDKRVQEIEKEIPTSDDDQLSVEFMRLMRLVGDGHTPHLPGVYGA